jgi:poly-gamma-glutamate synthesis protein (capsule biosynthesis protein)
MADGIDGWREQAGDVDLVCALPHWDLEFRHFPQGETRALARRLLVQGARLVVGGHAHVLQPVERIGEDLVAYGLGDFLGTVFSRVPWPLRIGAVLSVEISADDGTRGEIAAYRMAPFVRERYGQHEMLAPIAAEEARQAARMRGRLAAIFTDPGGQEPQKSL